MPMMLKMKKQEGKCELLFPMFCSDVFIVSDIVVDLKERDQSDGKIDASSSFFLVVNIFSYVFNEFSAIARRPTEGLLKC